MIGFGKIAKKVFGTPNDRMVKATRPLVEKINALEPEFQALSDDAIMAKTVEFKDRLAKAKPLTTFCPRPSPTPARPPAARSACAPSTCSWSAAFSFIAATSRR